MSISQYVNSNYPEQSAYFLSFFTEPKHKYIFSFLIDKPFGIENVLILCIALFSFGIWIMPDRRFVLNGLLYLSIIETSVIRLYQFDFMAYEEYDRIGFLKIINVIIYLLAIFYPSVLFFNDIKDYTSINKQKKF